MWPPCFVQKLKYNNGAIDWWISSRSSKQIMAHVSGDVKYQLQSNEADCNHLNAGIGRTSLCGPTVDYRRPSTRWSVRTLVMKEAGVLAQCGPHSSL